MPITIGRIEIQSSEHLYQAMRFPHLPDVQLQVLAADAPKTCKAIARQYDSFSRSNWGDIRVGVIRWRLPRRYL